MVKKGTCGLCQGGCAVVYTIEDGKIVKAEPDKESPKGRLCPRGALVPDILYGEERIKRPLIRVGERGEGKFRECSWKEAVADEGDFQGFGDFTMTESNKTMVMEQILNYTNRDLSFTVVFDTTTDTPELTSMTFDKVYSLGEKMGKAGMNTLMGMGTVFVILILISIIIYAFRIIPYLQNKKKNAADATAAKEDKVVEQIAQKEELVQDDLELVAVISAAIAAATGSSTEGFVVRSIKRR